MNPLLKTVRGKASQRYLTELADEAQESEKKLQFWYKDLE